MLFSVKGQTQKERFGIALKEISEMLDGKRELSFKRAVFITEDAYFDGKYNWDDFNAEIDSICVKLKAMIEKKNIQGYKTAENWAIFTYMSDSIPENDYYPYTYDFENFMNRDTFLSFTASYLFESHKGNCHSLPYMYKILAKEMSVEAFLAIAPMHLFIKHQDEFGKWWNLEMTTGSFSRTSWLIESFNISDKGIMSGFYLKPLTEIESVAYCLNDLLTYYEACFGSYSDEFVYECYSKGIEYFPVSPLQIWKLNDQKAFLEREMSYVGLSDYKDIGKYPKFVHMFRETQKTLSYLNTIGYSPITPELYEEKIRETIDVMNK